MTARSSDLATGASPHAQAAADEATGTATAARRPGRPRAASRADIRRIAVALFAEHGYKNTSLEQIATAAGISRTTLFAYFPAKHDLVWQELTERSTTSPWWNAPEQAAPTVDFVVELILRLGQYPSDARADLALRWRIAQEDEELRAYGAARTDALADSITAAATERDPDADPQLVDHVVHALIAVATRCLQEWSSGAATHVDLQDYTREGLQLIADALRPLLS